ncbi:MAG: bifunctional folylpolyglutamate synthase/ dihydrofolate synthase [Haliea sp.]|nr:bifunctional folylpolyglutamate synthase/ dihydrofolate synthase [Haliea sp.]
MTDASLADWLRHLESLHPREIELGLERVDAVARRLELLPVKVPVITVAGTNGKGSVVAVAEAGLLAAGRRPGVYTSPHLQRFNERIRIAGIEADDRGIVEAFEAVDAARGEISLTYFEFATLAALWLFRRATVDVLVLEVGLGGRLDAVNIVDPSVAVITRVALDHQQWLGHTREAIAAEKAGILRREAWAVLADPEPTASLREAVEAAGCQALWLGEALGVAESPSQWSGWVQAAEGQRIELPALPRGALLPVNLCAGLQALACLDLLPAAEDLPGLMATLSPPGRRQRRQVDGREWLLDVAHNPEAVEKLREELELSPCEGRTIAVFSSMADKDIPGMIRAAGRVFDAWFLADQPELPRAAAAADIARLLHADGQGMISVSRNLRQALSRARSLLGPADRLVVFGSFTTVGAALDALDRQARKVKA